MKKVLIGVGGLVAVIVVVLVVVWSSLDGIVKSAIETYGSEVTQTKVSVADVKLSLGSGEGSISGLNIGNPAGFSDPNLFKLGKISVKIDTNTVTQNPVVIDEVIIQSPSVSYEINKSGASNAEILKKNVAEATGGGGSSGSSSAASEPSGEEVKLIIRKLVIEGGKAKVKIAALGGLEQSVNIPRIQLKDIGKKSNGASAAEIAEQVSKSMLNGVTSAVSSLGVGKYIGKSADMFKDAAGKVGGVVSGAAGSVGDSVGGAAEKAGGALKGLFGN